LHCILLRGWKERGADLVGKPCGQKELNNKGQRSRQISVVCFFRAAEECCCKRKCRLLLPFLAAVMSAAAPCNFPPRQRRPFTHGSRSAGESRRHLKRLAMLIDSILVLMDTWSWQYRGGWPRDFDSHTVFASTRSPMQTSTAECTS